MRLVERQVRRFMAGEPGKFGRDAAGQGPEESGSGDRGISEDEEVRYRTAQESVRGIVGSPGYPPRGSESESATAPACIENMSIQAGRGQAAFKDRAPSRRSWAPACSGSTRQNAREEQRASDVAG